MEGVPVLWNHDAAREKRIVVEPDCAAIPRPGRSAEAAEIRATAARLHITLDFRFNSQSLAACITRSPALGGRAWPSFTPDDPADAEILALWLNTTPGLILFWWTAGRQQSGRGCTTIKRLPELPVLDTRTLKDEAKKKAHEVFEGFRNRVLQPAHEAAYDPGRKELDEAVLTTILGLPEGTIREVQTAAEKWCEEPSVHGGKQKRQSG